MVGFRVGNFSYGGNAWLADQFRDEFFLNGIELVTCHEYPNADVKYTPEGLIPFIDSMDAIICPTRFEVQPSKSVNRLGQAWSRGKPCIVAPLPAYLKYARHGENALIARERSDWLKHALALKNDPALRQKLGQAGREVAYKFLHPRDMVHHFLAAVQDNKQFLQVIIPHYADRTDYLLTAAASALRSDGPPRDVLVVSSAKEDPRKHESIRELGAKFPNFRVHHSTQRLSFSAANNYGLENLHPDTTHILLLNDDTIVSKGALKNMVDLVGERDIILNPYSNCDQGWLHQDRLNLGAISLHPGMTIEQFSSEDLFALQAFEPSTDRTLVEAPFCAMYATLFHKKVLDRVGLLGLDFSNGGEDADYSYRAHALGIKTYWTRSAFVFHFGGRTRKFAQDQNPTSHQVEDHHNNSLLQKKWYRNGKRAKRVAIWTGPAWEKWDLETYRTTGIGGSETCAGRLAETATANGCSVIMYGCHDTKEQNGFLLKDYAQFRPEEEYFDLFIASRNLAPVTEKLRAKRVLVWLHDIFALSHISPNNTFSEFLLNRVDKFLALSEWHKRFLMEYYPNLPENKIDIVPNGINVELFK